MHAIELFRFICWVLSLPTCIPHVYCRSLRDKMGTETTNVFNMHCTEISTSLNLNVISNMSHITQAADLLTHFDEMNFDVYLKL